MPDANIPLTLKANGPIRILGVGNGDPTFKAKERPFNGNDKEFEVMTFNGLAQVLVQAEGNTGNGSLTVEAEGMQPVSLNLTLTQQ